jgi:hypothetical protein
VPLRASVAYVQKTPLYVFKITNHHHYAKTAHHI